MTYSLVEQDEAKRIHQSFNELRQDFPKLLGKTTRIIVSFQRGGGYWVQFNRKYITHMAVLVQDYDDLYTLLVQLEARK